MHATDEPTTEPDDNLIDTMIGLVAKYVENPENVQHIFGEEAADEQAAINAVIEIISEEVALLVIELANKENDEDNLVWTNKEVKNLIAAYNVISVLGIHRFLENVLEEPEAADRILEHNPDIANAVNIILNSHPKPENN
jgi:hypothetical protein